jgi:tricorn protease
VVDLDGIEERVVAIPVPAGRYTAVAGAAGRVFFSSVPVEGSIGDSWRAPSKRPKGRLQAYDFTKQKVEAVSEGVSGFGVSADGKVLAIRSQAKLRVVPVGFKEESSSPDEVGRETGWVDMNRIRIEVDPGVEWEQMTREAWRLQRDQFWTEDMAGVDWKGVYRRYQPLVARIGSRAEFSDFMWEMQGELGTSHAYELGGDYRRGPQYNVGFLGADLEYSRRSGSWSIARLPSGDSWIPGSASPLAAPGLDVRVGDRIVAVNGVELSARMSPARALTDQAGRPVTVALRRGRRKAHSVVVKTLRTEQPLRYRDWVAANRATVHAATGGRVGYIHIPDMGPVGFGEFHRHLSVEIDRPGLIVDVRFNGGGNVSQLLIQTLLRRRIGYDQTRYGENLVPYPGDSPHGPMAALTNEWAGSDGDIFSHAFKLYGLGPLIGTRTWGGVVGVWPRHSLVDGTITTQPEFSYWFEDVEWGVENYGTDPDIEVVITPQDYREGRDPQLVRGIEEVERIIAASEPAVPNVGRAPSRKAPRLPRIEE